MILKNVRYRDKIWGNFKNCDYINWSVTRRIWKGAMKISKIWSHCSNCYFMNGGIFFLKRSIGINEEKKLEYKLNKNCFKKEL